MEEIANPFTGSTLVEHFELPKEYYQDPDTMKMLNYIWKEASKLAEVEDSTPMQVIVSVESRLNRGVGSDMVSGVYRWFLLNSEIHDKVVERENL